MTNENKELNNLRQIHDIQAGGEIQHILRELRSGKSVAENLAKRVLDLKKDKEVKNAIIESQKEAVKEVSPSVSLSNEKNVPEMKEAKVEVKEVKPVKEEKPQTAEKLPEAKVENASNDAKVAKVQPQQTSQTENQTAERPEPISRDSRPNQTFNRDRQGQPFNKDNRQPYNNDNRPFNRDNNFNQNRQGQPYQGNRPYQPFGQNNRQGQPFNQNNRQGQPFNRDFRNNSNSNGQPNPNGNTYNNNFRNSRPFDGTQNNNFRSDNPNYQKRVFGQNNTGTNNFERRPYQGTNPNFQRRPFGDRPFQANRPFAGNGQRPNSGFVQSRGNNMRVFSTLEDSKVLAQPERTFGNKNKSPRNTSVEEPKKFKKTSDKQRYVVMNDDFEEVQMGSKKLIKSKKKAVTIIAPPVEHAIITTENITVKNLSEKIGKPVTEIIKKLMILGIMATINSSIDFTTSELVANELGITLEQKLTQTAEQELTAFVKDEKKEDSVESPRPPVVAVMGHVDHGKTSLLDIIRKTKVAEGEAGGITQRIGAYQITTNGQKITFLDTPGHAAFTSMRARGAKITDVAILVVAADDGIMPQTIEAINHIKAAKVPMIVAINKMDKKEANPDRVKQQLSEQGVLCEEWGGDTICVPVSAKTGVGIDNLLSMILLVAQMQELKANPDKLAVGSVIEATLDKAKGPIATILVQNGTLHIGDILICGITYGKVKAMFDENGDKVKEATPSTPVSVLGLNEVPESGDQVCAVDEKLSKQVIEERKNKIKTDKTGTTSGVTLDDFMDKVNEGKLKNLNLIIKADVQGSVEALKQSLTTICNDEARVVCVHSGAGPVTESDLVLAKAADAVIINFNLKIESKIKTMADNLGVQIKDSKIIYEVVEDIQNSINGMKAKVYEKVVIGHANVKMVFKLSSSGLVAGCLVTDGKLVRNAGVIVMRGTENVGETTIEALKIQKDDKAEVATQFECGVKLKNFTDFKEGDVFEVFQNVEVKK